ncbi:hypothetical protein FC093_15755 [Ilyomonas limi]|uniref:Uncharacterized protein n=1 Tax=Ilyomonas limi TaxID=2575867 RepID=A0A4U3KYU1_9BACT|nr:hypothetical protein [Ilyomonas limi]TKK66954.1 hypothetical protein FC093_15755 [Ilyomonas limi]
MISIVMAGTDGRGHTFRVCDFVVNSKKYAGQAGGSYSIDKIYFVKFYPPDLSKNEAVHIQATDYEIQNLPPDGYKALPHH